MKDIFQKYKFIFILAAAVVVIDSVIVFLLMSDTEERETTVADRIKLTDEVSTYTNNNFKLVQENQKVIEANAEAAEAKYKQLLEELTGAFAIKNIADEDLTDVKVKRLVNSKLQKFNNTFRKAKIAYDGKFSFNEHVGATLPKNDEIVPIQKALWATEKLVDVLAKSGIDQVDKMIRPNQLDVSYKQSYGNMYTFDLELKGSNESVIKFLNELSNNKEAFFVIRYYSMIAPSQVGEDKNPTVKREVKKKQTGIKQKQPAFLKAPISVKVSIDWLEFNQAG